MKARFMLYSLPLVKGGSEPVMRRAALQPPMKAPPREEGFCQEQDVYHLPIEKGVEYSFPQTEGGTNAPPCCVSIQLY